ncbi:hypothetical protein AALB51_14435 [Lachnospiraceae bacterium 62-26]
MSILISGTRNYTSVPYHSVGRYSRNVADKSNVGDFRHISNAVTVTENRSTVADENQIATDPGKASGYLSWATEETGHKLIAVGGNASMDYRMWYAQESTEDNPVIIVDGITVKGERFERKLHLNDVSPYNATYLEMTALKSHYKLEEKETYGLPVNASELGPDDRMDFIRAYKELISAHMANNFQQWATECRRSLECYLTIPQKASSSDSAGGADCVRRC